MQYENRYVDEEGKDLVLTGYGRLVKIIEFQVPDDPIFEDYAKLTRLLAVITPCRTQGVDARKELAGYDIYHRDIVMDVRDIVALVGRVKSRGMWYIIDRFDSCASAAFNHDEVDEEGNVEPSDNEEDNEEGEE